MTTLATKGWNEPTSLLAATCSLGGTFFDFKHPVRLYKYINKMQNLRACMFVNQSSPFTAHLILNISAEYNYFCSRQLSQQGRRHLAAENVINC